MLVADASPVLRNVLREELEAEGFSVLLAEDGEAALERARDERPDLVLLETDLPSLEGYEVCRRLRAEPALAQIPIVFLSSRNELKDKLAGFEAGADDYLAKPFFTKELVARIRAHLRTREALEASRRLGEFYIELMFGIGSAIISPFKVDDELDVILRQALIAGRCRRGAILLLDPAQGILEVRGALGYNGTRGPRVGERYRISDKLPRLETASDSFGIGMYEDPQRGTLFVPMVAKEALVGGIELDFAARAPRLSTSEQKLLYALASQAAIFIENARLERDVRSMFLNIIVSMAGAVDAKDSYTHGHSLRVARVALLVGQERALSRAEMEPLLLSAILHDVGKIAIPDAILKKPTKLSRKEFEIMKTHTTAGAKMLAHIPALKDVIPGILQHHEYWNGSGYPDGLQGEAISLLGRIIHVGDAFDAMTTDRIYRRKVSVAAAMEEIERFSGIQFDPVCVAALRELCRQGRIHEGLPDTTPTLQELIEHIQ